MTKSVFFTATLLMSALVTGGCSSTFYEEEDDRVRITFGGGGLAKSKVEKYEEIAAKGKPVQIDGQMISADAFLAFGLPGACYTENAVFSPHAASYLGLVPSRKHTKWFASKLPEPLRLWFQGDISYHDWIGYAHVDHDQLLEIWPEGACREGEALAEGPPSEPAS